MNDKYLLVESILLTEKKSNRVLNAIIGGSIGALTWATVNQYLKYKIKSLEKRLKETKDPKEKKLIRRAIYQAKMSVREKQLSAGISVAFSAYMGYIGPWSN
jgi:flagellar motor component MotA